MAQDQFPLPARMGALSPESVLKSAADALGLKDKGELVTKRATEGAALVQELADMAAQHAQGIADTHAKLLRDHAEQAQKVAAGMTSSPNLFQTWVEYATDSAQRSVLFWDIMREVGNTFVEQQKGTLGPVLLYEYEMIMDGRTFERPVNYALVRILPPEGTQVKPELRPYMIIDPRAGHGAGIGGFKSDSQVGVALSHGHAVYFVIFFPHPEPGQAIADVTAAEGQFVREVALRHPAAPRPVIVGNCQGGWAAMMLAATNPHVTGPIVANGAPLSYWAGTKGKNPMRYMGGIAGGALPAILISDLGNGVFDGAWLVQNFETMNPGNTWWDKYFTVYRKADTEGPRFAGFERWWSGFYLMNEGEIRWIVENLFIGNKLQRGEAVLGGRAPVDLRQIKAPIIVFASHGDDITPPPQALNWIPRVYGDEREIRARGQRIIYMVHEDVGHLGIFVSAKVAKKEHDRIVSTLEAIEALAPGLYEMKIEKKIGEGMDAQFVVGFEERTIAQLVETHNVEEDEKPFGLVASASEMLVSAYELTARPLIKTLATPAMAEAMRAAHPMRARRYATSDLNPMMRLIGALAPAVREARKPADPANPFLAAERLWSGMVEQSLNFVRDIKAATDELTFFALWSNPYLARLIDGRGGEPNALVGESLRELPQVQAALRNIEHGGYPEGVIRMLILMAKSRGSVRQSRLERSNAILHANEPFRSMGEEQRAKTINEQALIVDFDPERAISTLPTLLMSGRDRQRAIELVEEIAGEIAEMSEPTVQMLVQLRRVLDLQPLTIGSAAVQPAAEPAPGADDKTTVRPMRRRLPATAAEGE